MDDWTKTNADPLPEAILAIHGVRVRLGQCHPCYGFPSLHCSFQLPPARQHSLAFISQASDKRLQR
jgi:hypothetical protein